MIINAFGHQFQNILQVFNSETHILAEKEITFPFEEKSFEHFIKKMIQKKLENVLNGFNKISLYQYSTSNNLNNRRTIWKNLLSLTKFSNYENTQLIFNILKIFTLIEFDNLCLFIDKIQDNKKSKNNFKLEDFYDLILNITKYTSLITNYFKFIYDNKEKEKILNFILIK